MKTLNVLSLFDHSGQWSQPYWDAGHNVISVDIKEGADVVCSVSDFDCEFLIDLVYESGAFGANTTNGGVDVILAAPPCTDFASSGAQYWGVKDEDGRTALAAHLLLQTLRTIEFLKPQVWAIENPVGRLNKLFPGLDAYGPWYWQPHWFGDAYTKKTGLWGSFSRDLVRNDVEPVKACDAGSWLMQLGGSSAKTKEMRSVTPAGFAQAFYQANSDLPEIDDSYYDDYPEIAVGMSGDLAAQVNAIECPEPVLVDTLQVEIDFEPVVIEYTDQMDLFAEAA